MDKLIWSKDIPIKEGWYWVDEPVILGHKQIIEVYLRPGHHYLCIMSPEVCNHTPRDFLAIGGLGAKWAGPLPEPKIV